MMWPFFAFLFCFPIARHYGEIAGGAAGRTESGLRFALRTLWRSLTDLRSLPLYAASLGVVLNLVSGPPPEFVSELVNRWHLLHALMIIGIFLQFGSIGMTIKASRIPVFWKQALGGAMMKFILSPLLMLGAALAMGLSGMQLDVCILLAAMPTAVYSILMANLFGLNRDLANTTFILTHAICFAVAVPALAIRYWVQ